MQVLMPIPVWIPGPLPGLNELLAAAKGAGGTGRGYSRLKRQWTETVWALAKKAQLPMFGRVRLRFIWYEANRRRDPDNIAAGGRKIILDGLVKAGVLPADGWENIGGWTDDFRVSAEPGVMVELSAAG